MAFVVFSAQYQFAVLCAKPLFFVGFLTTPSSTLLLPSGLPIRLVHRGQLSCRSFSEGSWQRLKHRDYWLHRRGAVPNASDLVGRAPHSSGAQLTPCAISHRQHSPPSKVFSLSPLTQYILVPCSDGEKRAVAAVALLGVKSPWGGNAVHVSISAASRRARCWRFQDYGSDEI